MHKTIITVITLTLSTFAFAAGDHEGGHGHDNHATHKHEDHSDHGHHGELSIGQTGKVEDVSRSIQITMLETDDGEMLFKPASFNVAANETVRLQFINEGELDHEFVMDDQHGIEEHRKEMLEAAESGHGDHHDHHGKNSISLKPGESGEIIWKFAKAGQFQFACLIPGHYEAGMHGVLTVQ